MERDELFGQKTKIEDKIDKLKEEKKGIQQEISKLEKKEEEKRKEKAERLGKKVYKIYSKLFEYYNSQTDNGIHNRYRDDFEDCDSVMLKELTQDNYNEKWEGRTELPDEYEINEIIDEVIKSSESDLLTAQKHIEMINKFKQEILKCQKE